MGDHLKTPWHNIATTALGGLLRTSDLLPSTRAYLYPVRSLYSYIQGLEINSVKMLSPFYFRIVYNLTNQLLFNQSFAIWGKSSLEMPLADVQKFGSGVQIQIACSAMSVVARYESISLSLMQLCSSICFISTMVACGAACHVRQLSHCGQILIPFLLRLGKEADAAAAKLCH